MVYECSFVPSPHSSAIQQSITRRRISAVWHLTRLSQLPGIFQAGALLSRAEMDVLGVSYGMSGWGSDAKARELENFICCSVVCPWGMSKDDPQTKALIQLTPKILLREGVLFCGSWSSFGQISSPSILSNCTADAFDQMFNNMTSPFPAPPPGEFLVPKCIPLSEFKPRLCFYDDETKMKATQLCGGITIPGGKTVADSFSFAVDRYCFRGSAQL